MTIKYQGHIWHLKQYYGNKLPYYSNGYDYNNLLADKEEYYFSESLNDKVEIIEDTPKEDKKLDYLPILKEDEPYVEYLEINQTRRKINEIIDRLNNKGDE